MDGTVGFEAGKAAAEQLSLGELCRIRPLLQQLTIHLRQLRHRITQKQTALTQEDPDRWLLDNQYLIELAAQSARDGFRGVKKLPADGTESGGFRLIALARMLSQQPEPRSQAEIISFLEGVQSVVPLLEWENRALLFALQFVALEELASALRAPDDAREKAFSHAFSNLRQWNDLDFQVVSEQSSRIHQAFLADPTGEYALMPPGDRGRYRQRLEQLARKQGEEEALLAQTLVSQAGTRHIGFLLFHGDPPYLRVIQKLYFPALTLFSLLLSLGVSFFVGLNGGFLLLWPLVFLMLKTVTNTVLLRVLPRRPVFRLSLSGGLTRSERTLLVKTVVLTGESSLEEIRQLECIYLANRDCGQELSLGLLADLPERREPISQGDRNLIRRMESAFHELNQRYDGRFFLLFRPPVYQSRQGTFVGWERKRGALLELARMLRSRRSTIEVYSGDRTRLNGVKYLVTLDSDTDPGVGGIRPLVGAMRHPLNRPVLDPAASVVTQGYAILQPQIRSRLSAARVTPFARLFSGGAGTDPYRSCGSELCHDLFDESSFCGKGILDIDCLLACLDGRFPEQRILSHDILEGAFLRTGYLGQISFGDGFPATVSGFYRRQHRWVRGDWQNLFWILGKIPRGEGREPNPLTSVSRWKLADNLRRSLVPVVQLICLLIGVLAGGRLGWLGWIALVSIALEPFVGFVTGFSFRGMSRRFHSLIWSGLGRTVLQIGVKLVLLPLEGWTNLSALTLALWRSLVSHKNMLQWTTFAQQSAGKGKWLGSCIPMLILGAFTLALPGTVWGKALAVFWLLSPVAVLALERKQPSARLRPQERAFLLHEAEQIWGFFADFLTPGRNYLPPDNFQLRPYRGVAERTSPTNIGFAALSCLAAVDLDLESRDSALNRIAGLLDTLEKMEKWKGNLYNWYHTITLSPMAPRVVSSVDSGNLCACLLALSTGLQELGREDLAHRALRLARDTDLGALYDKKKHLFYISYEPDTDTWSKAHYDLMASEARLLSYVALALGQVEHRHWGALSRAQTAAKGYQGMVSWFGTMFEYFMPHLLLPLPRDSFLYESLAFCACEQVRYGQKRSIPWGISESAVPALDQNGCYSYRANGIPAAALCYMPERTPVIAPYATYLTLSILPHRAVDNLQRLRSHGLGGKYGLYEAAEYSVGGIQAAKSWMSHHMGMSLLAIDNVLRDQIQIKRFMAQPELQAFQSLLEEEVPRSARPMRQKKKRPIDLGREKKPSDDYRLKGSGVQEEKPVCVLLPGANLSAVVTNSGYCYLSAEQESLTARQAPPAVYLRKNDRVFQLFPCQSGADLNWCLSDRRCDFSLGIEGAEVRLSIVRSEAQTLDWNLECSGELGDSTLFVVLHPQLAGERDFLAHPTFSLLRIETEQTGDSVTFRRRGGDGEHPELRCWWTGRGVVPVTGPQAARRLRELGVPAREPGLLLELPLHNLESGSSNLTLRLDTGEAGPRKRVEPVAIQVRNLAWQLLPELIFAPQLGSVGTPGPQRLLWELGISGDDPIVLGQVPEEKDAFCQAVLAWQLLSAHGIPFDLVFLGTEAQKESINAWARELEISLGGHCGLHWVFDQSKNRALLQGMACAVLDNLPEKETKLEHQGAVASWLVPKGKTFEVRWEGDSLTLAGGLPPVRWSIPLTNGKFGYLALDTGGGYLWSQNARLFRVTPWSNDPWGRTGPEELAVVLDGKEVSLFARQDEYPCTLTFGTGFLRWEKEFGGQIRSRVTAFVPEKRNERIFLVELENFPSQTQLVWRMQPQMGEFVTQGLWARAEESEGKVWLKNPVTERSGICLSASTPWQEVVLPQGRRRQVEFTFSAQCAATGLVLQAGEPCSALGVDDARRLLEETIALWHSCCCGLEVETPDEALNHYLSFWGQYQVQASRMLSRTSIYQCGGAYGFRDQLQDICALIQSNPQLAQEQILRCCCHQFMEGDVLHWWHEIPGGGADAGVRTRISDDLLWLPYALSVWWEETGKVELLEREIPYLLGQRLNPEEHDRYFAPEQGSQAESVYRHGIRAIECVLGRGVGAHGLCKMGSGDWNDGMDQVGVAGKGESVWLTWFAALVLRRYADVCEAMSDRERAVRYRDTADSLVKAAEQCWDGAWFLRGYFDSGEPLGGKNCPECQIDSISQSFAVLAGADREKVCQALESAQGVLLDGSSGTVALLDPPFDGKGTNPGYIADYRPGNRENGGQYTHAAVWLALAWFRVGQPDRGWRILRTLLPEHHPMERYQGECFVLAADVCREAGKEGAAGWTWYTGAAGWYWRVAVQELLGLRFRGGLLYLEPQLPFSWPGYKARLKLPQGVLEIQVVLGTEHRLTLDGTPVPQGIDCMRLVGHHCLRMEILQK